MKRKLILLTMLLGCLMPTWGKVKLARLFQPGMVLQRGKPMPVWGRAAAGEQVTISWNKRKYQTTADATGHWRIDLPQMKAGGPYVMEVGGAEAGDVTRLENVLVGDVWLCSGQSNIDVTIERVYPQYVGEIEAFGNDKIRLFRVQNETDTHGPKDDIGPTRIAWLPLTKQNAWGFSAVGTFLALRMYDEYKVPQGVIVNSWGGTPIEAWIAADSLPQSQQAQLAKTRLYQDGDMVKALQEANRRAGDRWTSLLDSSDPGMATADGSDRSPRFAALGCDDSQWREIDRHDWRWPAVGSTWLRQHVNIDRAHAGQPARLLLGTLFDADYTYLNGREIGRTYYQYPPRRYDIPAGMLREGDNVITIRFVNKYGAAHFIDQKPYLLAFGDDRQSQNPMPADIIPLADRWLQHDGALMPACPSSDVALQNMPTTLYNAVLHPLAPYALSGIVWYQGESNTGNPAPYADLLRRLMGCWRDRWSDPEMPFVIVQLANYDGRQQSGNPQPITPQPNPVNSNWARLRESQRIVAAEDGRAELAVINDLGETVDIHPLRKKEVAQRIGRCLDRLLYNNKVKLSPVVTSARYDAGRQQVELTLDQPVEPVSVGEMELSTDGRRFRNAEATAEGNRVVIKCRDGERPTVVRYAWKDNPTGANLRSMQGLPMSSFEQKILHP